MTITISTQIIWFIIGFVSANTLWIGLLVWMYKVGEKKKKNDK